MANKSVEKIKKILRRTKYKTLSTYYRLTTRKKEDKIIFFPTAGSYTCNPKSICEEIIKEKLPYKLVWVVNKRNIETKELRSQYPKQVKTVVKGSKEFYKEVYSSRVWIDNAHNFGRRFLCEKPKGVLNLQTFHGAMGLKKIGVDNGGEGHKTIVKNLKYQAQVDHVISNSEFENMVYRTSYWPKTDIWEFGHARNDIFFKDKNDPEIKAIDKKVREYLNIDKDTKIFLYAPTFRKVKDDSIISMINFEEVKSALEKRFGGKWVMVVRFHELERKSHLGFAKEHNLIDATLYPNMQELLAVVNVGLTDYSSWICDYVLTKNYGFLFVPDMENYAEVERGLYYPLSETPFPIAMTNKELVNNILKFDEKKYQKDKDEFLKKRGSFEKGNASIKIVEKIKEFMQGE